jgi:hypothetical protein
LAIGHRLIGPWAIGDRLIGSSAIGQRLIGSSVIGHRLDRVIGDRPSAGSGHR